MSDLPPAPELRRKEWYLEEAVRLSHVGSWTLDLGSGSLGFWSDETFRIVGLPPGTEVPGKGYLERFVHPKDLPYAFFFSSRRRHTRWTGDWSSDVCSSD